MEGYRKNDNKTLTSKLEWTKKYDAEKMDIISIKCPKAEKERYKTIATENNMKLAEFMRKCAMYIIDNNIDIS